MGQTVKIDNMVEAVMEGLREYSEVTTELVKNSVVEASREAKQEISDNAPEKTGKYKKSWTTKKIEETSNSLTITVYSKNRYQLAHLLENGHVKRGGGRVSGIPHIAPAEANAVEIMKSKIEKGIKK